MQELLQCTHVVTDLLTHLACVRQQSPLRKLSIEKKMNIQHESYIFQCLLFNGQMNSKNVTRDLSHN